MSDFINKYPYTDFHELNLDYVLSAIKLLTTKVDNFINLNTIKYANPIQWNITSQYEANTVVIDPQTGDAYISIQAVPNGVSIGNTSYWTPIFNYSGQLSSFMETFTPYREVDGTLAATFASPKGRLLLWNNVLYIAITNININDAYVEGVNIYKVTMYEIIGNLADLHTRTQNSIVDAINEVNDEIEYITPQMYGAAADGVTDDTQAINDALTACFAENKTLYFPNGQYYTTSTINVTLPTFDIIMDGEITCNFTGAAIKIYRSSERNHKLKVRRSGTYAPGCIGVEISRCVDNVFTINSSGYEIGVHLYTNDGGISYNTFNDMFIVAYNIGVKINSDGTGWVNENVFNNLRAANASGQQITGVLIESDRHYYNNNNVFIKPCVEGCKYGFDIVYGNYTTIYSGRFEGMVTAGVITRNNSKNNKLIDPYASGSYDLILNDGNDCGCYYINNRFNELNEIYDIGKIFATCANNASELSLPEDTFTLGSNYTKVPTAAGSSLSYSSMNINGSTTACYWTECRWNYASNIKRPVRLLTNMVLGAQARIRIVLFDDNNVPITDAAIKSDVAFTYTVDPNDSTISYYESALMSTGAHDIEIPFNCKRFFIGIKCTQLKSFKISADYQNNMYTISDTASGLNAIPTAANITGKFINNIDYVNNPTVRGWYYDGNAWQVVNA